MEDENRISGNAAALAKVESTVISLEEAFTKLAAAEAEQERLRIEVERSGADESAILGDTSLSEKDAIKRTTEAMARKAVYAARHAAAVARVKEQVSDLANQGESVRRAFQFVVGRVYVSRENRVIAQLTELFGGSWIILRDGARSDMKCLSRHTRLMKEIRNFDITVSHPLGDPEQEEIALRQRVRLWLAELADLVTNEPGLALTSLPGRRQPIEEPAAEMATA
jgi:hypothetical protein